MGLFDALKKVAGEKVGEAMGQALGEVVKPHAEKLAEALGQVAGAQMDAATQSVAQVGEAFGEVEEAAAGVPSGSAPSTGSSDASATFGQLGSLFGSALSSMQGFANNMAQSMKECPQCGQLTTSDKDFCPYCGAKLPETTVAQGFVCPTCGHQNDIGAEYCAKCGSPLAAVLEAQRRSEEDWNTYLAPVPAWNGGGREYEFCVEDGYFFLSARLQSAAEAQAAVESYRQLLLANGFVSKYGRGDLEHLVKTVDGKTYEVDTEHCFEGDDDCPTVYFLVS